MRTVLLPLFVISMIAAASALSCYQGVVPVGSHTLPSSSQCSSGALTCAKTTDQYNVNRFCQSSNCTYNFAISNDRCDNVSSTTEVCCCYKDNCNSAPTLFKQLPAVLLVPALVVFLCRN